MDFTLKSYRILFDTLIKETYCIIPNEEYFHKKFTKEIDNFICILRHDVDRLPRNALQTAIIEHELDIRGTYYFRVVSESYDLKIMEKIAQLGHEIGYHYEDVDLVSKGLKETETKRGSDRGTEGRLERLIDRAYESFCKNLESLRKNFDIKTICMHGSPRSKYDNRLIWTKYDYQKLGIVGEPYFDIDFSVVAYYTDTGRRWDGDKISVRDKVGERRIREGETERRKGEMTKRRRDEKKERFEDSRENGVMKSAVRSWHADINGQRSLNDREIGKFVLSPNSHHVSPITNDWPRFRKTQEMIRAIEDGRFPEKALITVHPQRWTNQPLPWIKELVWQNVKNAVKYFIVKRNRAGG